MPDGLSSSGRPVVVFDIDGTLLDSAPGIIAGFTHALRSVGLEPPDPETLRRDLGPPVEVIFTSLGLPAPELDAAVGAYRSFYARTGLMQSRPYRGVVELLEVLRDAGVVLATATAKLTEVAQAIMAHHGLDRYFEVVNGGDELRHTKTEILDHTLELLGRPSPQQVAMVGDWHSDVGAARACGVLPLAVTWGYGSERELLATSARLLRRPADLLGLPLLQDRLEPSRR